MEIQNAAPSDAEELLSIYAPYVRDTAVSFEYEVPSVAEFGRRIRSFSVGYPYLKAVQDGVILGYAYAHRFAERKSYDWTVETTVYVCPTARRGGIGRKLYEALEGELRRRGFRTMVALVATTDHPDARLTADSPAFHERMGFVKAGTLHRVGYKFETWYDLTYFEKQIVPPDEPVVDIDPAQ